MKAWPVALAALLLVAGAQAWGAALVLRDRAEETSLATQLAAERARADALAAQSEQARSLLDASRAQASGLAQALLANETRAATLASALETTARDRDVAWAQANDSRAGIFDRQALLGELESQRATYDALQARYQDALNGAFPTLASIQSGNVTWRFEDASGQPHAWRYPLEDYQSYAKEARPGALLLMQTAAGGQIAAADPRPYVTPSFFAPHVAELTANRSDRQFVQDAFALKSQLVTYGFALADQGGLAYKFPAETLTEGAGLCGDTTILLASLLLAGEEQARYGLKLKVWLVDVDPGRAVTLPDATTVNHALLEVDFRDGATWYLETTTSGLYRYPEVHGWSWDVADPETAA